METRQESEIVLILLIYIDIDIIVKKWSLRHRDRNKLVKILNGNRTKKSLKILHWNIRSRFWINKQEEIQCVVDEQDPDIMFVTEANLFKEDPNHRICIDIYKIETPKRGKMKI